MPAVVAQPTATALPKQLSDQNSEGTCLGASATDKIGFYMNGQGEGAPSNTGATNPQPGSATGSGASGSYPVVQPSGPQQAAIGRGLAAGMIATMLSTQSPTAVQPTTTAEQGLTLLSASSTFQIASGDLLYVNKPTSQAGLGVGNVRVSAANVMGITFSNLTAATITPTASQAYAVVAVRGLPSFTPSLSPAAVVPNTTTEQIFTVAGVRAGELLNVMKPTVQAGLDIVGVRAVGANQVGITFLNTTAATITPTASETYTIWGMGGLDSVNNQMVYGSIQSPASVANATSAEQGLTVTGLATTDIITGISKPTAQAGLGIVGQRVSAANTLGLTFGNFTAATITPTASQVYEINVLRPNPVAPLVIYQAALTPVAVAPNTTAEQTFTITGLVASSPVWVNKPSAQSGLGIAGVRVSALNTLAINFVNATGATITPTAGETYIIGNFQVPMSDAGSHVLQSVSNADQAQSILANGMRAALDAVNLIAGG